MNYALRKLPGQQHADDTDIGADIDHISLGLRDLGQEELLFGFRDAAGDRMIFGEADEIADLRTVDQAKSRIAGGSQAVIAPAQPFQAQPRIGQRSFDIPYMHAHSPMSEPAAWRKRN